MDPGREAVAIASLGEAVERAGSKGALRPSRRRDDVLRAARRVFSQKGYHGASMRDLGEAVGLRRGSLYAHIASKAELLFEVIDAGADEFLRALAPIAASPRPAAERLRQAFRAHAEVVAGHSEAATVFFHEWRFLAGEARALILAKRDRYEALWRSIVEDGMAAGEFRPGDARLVTIWLLSAANWLYQWFRPDGPLSAAAVADAFADLALSGLAGRGPGEA